MDRKIFTRDRCHTPRWDRAVDHRPREKKYFLLVKKWIEKRVLTFNFTFESKTKGIQVKKNNFFFHSGWTMHSTVGPGGGSSTP